MSVQNIVDLTGTDRVAYCLTVCLFNLADLYEFSLLGSCLKGSKDRGFFLEAQIPVIPTIVVS